MRRRSSRMLKKLIEERVDTAQEARKNASPPSYTRYCIFNDSAQYEAHVTFSYFHRLSSSINVNDSRPKGPCLLCKSTPHIKNSSIQPGKINGKRDSSSNIICNDNSTCSYVRVKNYCYDA
uniref:Uncharacterized protein n=1 Tax=Lygus hesperus TaxID=30085 RepID=A0A146L740_LYGHE